MAMKGLDEKLTATREGTNASLEAEREATNIALDRAAHATQAKADAQLAEARAATDGELIEARAEADRKAVAHHAVPPSSRSGIVRERSITDAVLAEEREQVDAALAVERDAETPAAVVEQLRDVTDTKLTDEREQVDTALDSAEEQLARRQQILAMVTHDLRQPLTIFELCIERLVTGRATSEAATARDAIAQMRRLVADLLDLASFESGTFRVVRNRCDLLALLAEVSDAHQPLFRAGGQCLEVDRTLGEVVADVDRARIVQVIGNLLSNAMRFSPQGALVTLGAVVRDDEAVVTVRNFGPMIPAAMRAKLFERFSHGGERHGLGLGLFIARCIVEAHGGQIVLDSAFAEGASFSFTLPRAPSPAR